MNGIIPDRDQTLAIMFRFGTHQQKCQACRALGLPPPGKDGFVTNRWRRQQQIDKVWQETRRLGL